MHRLATSLRVTHPRVLLLFLAALVLGVPAGTSAAGLRVATTPSGELFPALDLSQAGGYDATSGGGNGLLRIHVDAARPSRELRLVVETDGLVAPSVVTVPAGGAFVARPLLRWDAAGLRGLATTRRQPLRVRLEDGGVVLAEQAVQVSVHPLHEALYYVRDGEASVDLGWAFAAWVDPHDRVVDELIALAAGESDVPLSSARDRATRLAQVRALWRALERRGIRYANEGAAISQGPVIFSQRVRLLSDTWDGRVANCLDGSVLIASALERLGIPASIVLVPGHAFIGFQAQHGARGMEFLETTLLGPGGKARLAAGTTRFDAALAAGMASYRRAQSRLDGRHRPHYAVVDIPVARSYGIMPLAAGQGPLSSAAGHAPANEAEDLRRPSPGHPSPP
ncbi:hypothetical protein ACQQ2N_02315 [Dokdonella sp. MW10]|uniref:hypothetical protein n=1 Tax=Dokdonella sp. MW10 TaxID=2992926 RepID=UPI003F7EE0A4